MPVQFIFAGKAHPADKEGKKIIADIIHLARKEGFKNRIVFVEDYDMESAHYLVQGADVWLNTPRRPMEACGTSGMKVAINGGINLSIPDGWWDEAYPADIGWTIGRGEEYDDIEYQDFVESQALYDILENSVIPSYYNRRVDNIPKDWIHKLRLSLAHSLTNYNSERMLSEYLLKYYSPASRHYQMLISNNYEKLREFSAWINNVRENWDKVHLINFSHLSNSVSSEYCHGDATVNFEVEIEMGNLKPEDFKVTIFFGREDQKGKIINNESVEMDYAKTENQHAFFSCYRKSTGGGIFYYSVRIIPDNPLMMRKLEPDLVIWS
jgi:starch phosphorylase